MGKDLSLLNFDRSETFFHTCSGTIGTSRAVIVACGFFSSTTSLVGLGAVTLRKLPTKLPFAVAAAWSVIILLKVQAASWAVTFCPSDHFASERMVYVQVSLSADGAHLVARPGTGCASPGS